ncbi:MAG: hypothetical protein ACXU9Z_16755 [Gemmatimonadaceae bacterium]
MADKDNKSIKPGAIPIYVAPDGTKFYREEDIKDDVREQLKKQREELERKTRGQPAAEGWEYAVIERELTESADAAIVRSPDLLIRPLLVFHNQSLNDRLVSLARVALSYTEATSKPLTSQQLVLVWADGSIKIDGTPDRMENLTLSEQGESAKFRRISGTPRNVHGLGEVRVVGSAEDF